MAFFTRSLASGVVSANASVNQLTLVPGAASANDGTAFAPASSTNYNVGPGVNVIGTPAGTITGTGKGWIYDTALVSTLTAGTWTVNFCYNYTVAGCLAATGSLVAEVYKVTATTTTVTAVTLIGTANTGALNFVANTDTQVSATFSGAATTFAAGNFLYVQVFLESTNPRSGTFANRVDNPTLSLAENIVSAGTVIFDPPFTQYAQPSILAQ